MALPTTYTAPKDPAELERRKILAGKLKTFASSPDAAPEITAESLAGEASGAGISRNQLSNLYAKYKSEGTPPTETEPTTGLSPTLSSARSFFSPTGPTPAAAPPPATSSVQKPSTLGQPATPLLDRYAEIQSQPLGSSRLLSQTRALGSESGASMRQAKKLQRMGFGKAAEQVALAGATQALAEPKIKTQEYIGFQEQMGKEQLGGAAADLELKRKQREYQTRLLQANTKALDTGGLAISGLR